MTRLEHSCTATAASLGEKAALLAQRAAQAAAVRLVQPATAQTDQTVAQSTAVQAGRPVLAEPQAVLAAQVETLAQTERLAITSAGAVVVVD